MDLKERQNTQSAEKILSHLAHYLPAQNPLKDFVHHNTLHAFQGIAFHEALHQSSQIFGHRSYISLKEYRLRYRNGEINEVAINQVIRWRGLDETWTRYLLLEHQYDEEIQGKIGKLRGQWRQQYGINFFLKVQPVLFRILGNYLDQGIAIWRNDPNPNGFLASIRDLQTKSYIRTIRSTLANSLLMDPTTTLDTLLELLVGNQDWYETYLFDQQFSHPGWSGLVANIEKQPDTLLDQRKISLRELVMFELLLEIDALELKHKGKWQSMSEWVKGDYSNLFKKIPISEYYNILQIWQEAFEWSYHDQAIKGVLLSRSQSIKEDKYKPSHQALFCIDDRECSIRRHLEYCLPTCQTYGTAGYFGVEFFYQPLGGKFHTKLCPAPVKPRHLIKEFGEPKVRGREAHLDKKTHHLFHGWLNSSTLGFITAGKLFVDIFKPTLTPATNASFRHLEIDAKLMIEAGKVAQFEAGLQLGFKVEEMTQRVSALLTSIGLVKEFSKLIYLIGHGSTSVNNTHYAGYDCGACCGRPGSINAKVMAYMANHAEVREQLKHQGIVIPGSTRFVGALHDTTRDEICYYDLELLDDSQQSYHTEFESAMTLALEKNATERARRFETIDRKANRESIHQEVKRRSVSLFEPRPELNHASNALCIVGRRELTKHLYLDRRAFMNSYDYRIDLDGKYLSGILNAVAPVCGGINLEYYFSRVDNLKLGAGTKLPHNVMGLIGVSNGTEGDLRPGLPSQMIEVHDPVRLMVIVEQKPEIVLIAMKNSPATYEWFANEWVKITAIDPETGIAYRWDSDKFIKYQPFSDVKRNAHIHESLDCLPAGNIPVQCI